ncbi:MAG: SH3 domain-containing protein, partial [Alphaproteobacteria bacterium]|nr:SH3 domain-containing protein [Alphaproteobacteria bacterium]
VAQSDEPSAGRIELAFWQSIQNSKMAADYEAYLATYPQGKFSLLARNRLASLQAPKAPPKKAAPKDDKQAAEIAFWRSIQQSKNADDYRAYLKAYPNGAFKPIADNRIKQLESQPSTAAAKPKTSEAPKVAALPRLALTPVEAAFVVVRNANVRARPTTDSSVVARLKAGAEVYVDSKTKDGTWMRVERDGKDLGYMFAPLLQDKQRWQEASNRRAAERRAQEDAARRRSEEDATRRRSEEDAARRRSEEDAARRRAEEDAARRQAEESAATRRRQQQAAVVAPRKPVGYDGSWRLIVGAQSFEQGDHGRAERTITVSDGRFQAQLRAGPTSYGVQGEIVDGRLSGVLTVNFADPWLPISVDLRGSVRGGGFEKRYSKSTHDGHDGWDDNYLTLNVDIALRRN